MVKYNAKHVADLADTKKTAKRLADAVELCRDKAYWVPALVLVTAGIDRFGGGSKTGYQKLLRTDFPDLCKHLTPSDFYAKYRNGILHEFSPKKGYALANDHEIGGNYFAEVIVRSNKKKLKALNVDRLIKDFLKLAHRISK